ncbi:ATP12 family chaperone protein [Flaviflagellibacter deserti]|uniref:ATP12 family chaperone protein n=1 Tax=Flaviflagellibacter deserti TaxID=2267266 RepID=A0ABV9Z2Z4_9HYPH
MSNTDGPMQAAQRLMRPTLSKRFYEKAEAAEIEGGWGVMLDGRPVRTPAKTILSVPRRELAEELAQEWQAQVEVIDPNRMPLTRLVNSALDGVSRESDAVRAEIVKYAGSDLICYRAEGPDRLVAQQTAAWNPVLDWAHDHLGVRFVVAEGVMFVSQPPEALDAVAREVENLDVLRLSALSTSMTLTGSTLISLALLRGRLSLQESWAAAHVDEDWNIELWGADDEAMERRAARFEEMQAAARLMALA